MTTTPYDKTESSSSHFTWVRGTKQSPITAAPLPYRAEKHKKHADTVINGTYPSAPNARYYFAQQGPRRAFEPKGSVHVVSHPNGSSGQPREARLAYSKAFSRFTGKLGPTMSLGATFAEASSAYKMIADRSLLLVKSYKALKRGQFKKFLKLLKARPLNKHKATKWTKSKDASALWLEYWFGWSPILSELFSAVEMMQTAVPSEQRVTAYAKMPIDSYWLTNSNSPTSFRNSVSTAQGSVYCKIGASIYLDNPNLFLANQMGLINPLEVAFEVVPFSFLGDWAANLSQVIQALTWDVGLTVKYAYSTIYWREITRVETSYKEPRSTGSLFNGTLLELGSSHVMRRDLGIAMPAMVFYKPEGLSKTRAATAVSLLVSIFTQG